MGRPPKPVLDGPLKEFAEGLRALREASGKTYRQLAQRAGFGISTLSAAAAGERLPTLDVTLAFVGACDGDQEEWSQRWADLRVILKATDPGLLAPENREGDEKHDTRPATSADASGGNPPPLITPWDRSVARRIGRYRVLGTLNRGNVAHVHLAADRTGEPLAVKVLSAQAVVPEKESGGRLSEFRRFEEELDVMRSVHARNMPPLIDGVARAKQPWMATRFLPGPTVARAVESTGALPEEFVLALAAAIAETLVDLHAAGIVHRDLKPANVLLTAQGPRVIDLGVARAGQRSTMTMRGDRVGTLAYMAPEQAEGKKVTAAADIFSLGCLLAYAATAVEPFSGEDGSIASTLYRIAHSEPDEAALACQNKQLRTLIESCLAKYPAQRPAAEQILESFAPAPSETPWSLPPAIAALAVRYEEEAQALLGRAARRRTVRRAGAATAAVLLVLGITTAGVLLGGDRNARTSRTGGPLASPSHAVPRSATPARVETHQGTDPAASPSATAAATPTNTASSSASTPSPGSSVPLSGRTRYSFDCGTDGWGRLSGDATVGFSNAQHLDGACSLTIHDTSATGAVPAVAAVTGVSGGPAAGTRVTAWVYFPAGSGQSIRAALYVTDARGQQHMASLATVYPSTWHQLTYTPTEYSGAATSLGLQFTKSGTADLTVYFDEVAW